MGATVHTRSLCASINTGHFSDDSPNRIEMLGIHLDARATRQLDADR